MQVRSEQFSNTTNSLTCGSHLAKAPLSSDLRSNCRTHRGIMMSLSTSLEYKVFQS